MATNQVPVEEEEEPNQVLVEAIELMEKKEDLMLTDQVPATELTDL